MQSYKIYYTINLTSEIQNYFFNNFSAIVLNLSFPALRFIEIHQPKYPHNLSTWELFGWYFLAWMNLLETSEIGNDLETFEIGNDISKYRSIFFHYGSLLKNYEILSPKWAKDWYNLSYPSSAQRRPEILEAHWNAAFYRHEQ